MDPAVARFIAIHHRSARESAEEDVEPHRSQSLEESWADLRALCRSGARILAGLPDRDLIVAEVDPPHPSYHGIIRRLMGRA
jgi:hypothetical protein